MDNGKTINQRSKDEIYVYRMTRDIQRIQEGRKVSNADEIAQAMAENLEAIHQLEMEPNILNDIEITPRRD